MSRPRRWERSCSPRVTCFGENTTSFNPTCSSSIAAARSSIIGPQYIEDAPDLVVEVASPFRPGYDTRTKLRAHARHVIAHDWIVDPQARSLTEATAPEGETYARERMLKAGDAFAPALWPEARFLISKLFPAEV